ncbi:MAG: hypothetical protein IMX06_10465 [Kyrpidia tusciae]|nr:hypothetical protein [Kyrpidia tusciae]MBE3553269.1 hypothetical protein [Kyrpidia tusciae]
MRSWRWLTFTGLNVRSYWMPRKVAFLGLALLALGVYGGSQLMRTLFASPAPVTYIDYAFWMFGSLFNPQPGYFPVLEAMKLLYPYMVFSAYAALYMREELERAAMTLPRVGSYKAWYGSQVLTLYVGLLGYLLLLYTVLALSTIGTTLSSPGSGPDTTTWGMFPQVGKHPLGALLAYAGVQVVALGFFQALQWVVTLATASAVTGFTATLLVSIVVCFTPFPNPVLHWIPGVQWMVRHNAVIPAFAEGIPVLWSYGYLVVLQVVILAVGWKVVRNVRI